MPKKTRYHVTKRDGSWRVQAEGGSRASSLHGTQGEAVRRAAEVARNRGEAQVFVHRPDGRIRDERTYGTDPHPPNG